MRTLMLVGLLLLPACSAPGPAAGGKDVLATVNGAPLREVDYQLASRRDGRPAPTTLEAQKGVLEGLVREQLMAEQALKLGLEKDAAVRATLDRLDAEALATRRHALAQAFEQKEITDKATPTDAEAKAWYDAHGPALRTEFHLLQLQAKTEAELERLRAQLQQGKTFEELSAQMPWDLGWVRWGQYPDPWRPALEKLKDGEVSDVIRGPRGRFWLLQLVARRENLEATFERLKPTLVEVLKRERLQARADEVDRALRATAKVSFVKEMTPPRPPSTDE